MSFSEVEVYDLSCIYSLAIVKVIEINNILNLRYFYLKGMLIFLFHFVISIIKGWWARDFYCESSYLKIKNYLLYMIV